VDLQTQSGKSAHTSCLCLASQAQNALIYCQLHTGRTHQIRVHLAWQGLPLVADTLYGGRVIDVLSRQALHAFRLSLNHPCTGQSMTWSADWPLDLERASLELGLSYNLADIPAQVMRD
jgi:23S rRNA pseudouridine1911/1915/1917 synthase